jgi:hypothetical protein
MSVSRELPRTCKYELFIAAPMSALGNDEAYAVGRRNILELMERLSTTHGLEPIYYAGAAITDSTAFTGEANALRRDLEALRGSRLFVLIYPSKIVTSALVEVGYALALRLPCLLLVSDKNDLPYLLNQVEASEPSDLLPPLRIRLFRETALAAHEIAVFRQELLQKEHTDV